MGGPELSRLIGKRMGRKGDDYYQGTAENKSMGKQDP